jgi:hypothetical protein
LRDHSPGEGGAGGGGEEEETGVYRLRFFAFLGRSSYQASTTTTTTRSQPGLLLVGGERGIETRTSWRKKERRWRLWVAAK